MPDSLLFRYVTLAGAAFAAGTFNAIAGGGSFFSFPALLGFGLPPINANATNTVALWPGHLSSLVALRRELRQVGRSALPVMLCSAIGGTGGGIALLLTKQAVFMRLVPWLLLIATTLFLLGDPVRKWLESRRTRQVTEGSRISGGTLVALTLVCVYIGYFGAGAAFLIYAVFAVLGNATLHQVIAIKSLCNAVANALAIATFIFAGAVYWRECLIMVTLTTIGGYMGSIYARRFSPGVLRWTVAAIGFSFSLYYFWKIYR